MPEAGWFPDPSGRYQYRYWNGSVWTEQVSRDGVSMTDPAGSAPPPSTYRPVAAPAPTAGTLAALAEGSTKVKVLVLGGAAALVLGSLLPWVKATAGIFTATKNGIDGDGVLTLILAVAVAAVFVFVRQRNAAAVVTTVLGSIAAAISLYDVADVSKKAHDLAASSSAVSAHLGIGLIIAAAASIVIIVGGAVAIGEARGR